MELQILHFPSLPVIRARPLVRLHLKKGVNVWTRVRSHFHGCCDSSSSGDDAEQRRKLVFGFLREDTKLLSSTTLSQTEQKLENGTFLNHKLRGNRAGSGALPEIHKFAFCLQVNTQTCAHTEWCLSAPPLSAATVTWRCKEWSLQVPVGPL